MSSMTSRMRHLIISICFGLLLVGGVLATLNPVAASFASSGGPSDQCFVEATGDNITDFSSTDASALQTAAAAASPSDILKIAGTCAGVQAIGAFTQTVYLTQSLTLQGGYTATNWLAAPDPAAFPTILDASDSGRVIYIAANAVFTLDSLTLTGGNGHVGGGNTYGGAIRLPGGATLNIINSLLHHNQAERGGVLNTSNGVVNLTDSLLMYNTAAYRGGTLYGESSSQFNLTSTMVLSNTAAQGGALHSSHSTDITLVDSVIAYNTGTSLAGGILNFGDLLTIISSTLSHNTTPGTAGAIYNTSGGVVHAYNSTISNNSAGSFGGIYQSNTGFTTTLVHTTVAENSATNGIGGIRLNGGLLSTTNSILDNSGFDCSLNGGTVASGGYNLTSDATCPLAATGDITNTNPLLLPLADNGGATETHGLGAGSPAIDHIPSGVNGCGTTTTVDQRGLSRPQGSGCEPGSFEYEPPIVCFVETTGDNVTDYSSADATALQSAVNAASPGSLLKVAGTCAGIQSQGGQTQTVYISQTLGIQGGYTMTNWLAAPDPMLYPTVLDAEGNGRVAYIPNGYQVSLDNVLLTGGNTTAGGGAIYSNGVLTVTNSTIANNSANNGSGIRNDNTLTVAAVTFSGNNSSFDGTIRNAGWADIQASTFYTNTALRGGGIYADGGSTLAVTNSTFAHNTTNEGGGIHNRGAMTVTNSTFAYNAATFGSAIHTWNGAMSLYNNIMANNVSTACLNQGTLIGNTNNLIDDGSCSPLLTADPLLAPLSDNGGPTWTFMPQAGSPAIDAGDAATCAGTDQRGVARPEGALCDIGAVEAEQEALEVLMIGTGSGTVNSDPAGINCGITCTASFYASSLVTLSATAETGSTFAGWSGAGCSGTADCVLTMDTAKAVTATFTLNQFELSLSFAGAGSGSVTSDPAGINCTADCSASFDYNTVVTLTATAEMGSTFTGWSGASCSGTAVCVVTMSEARSVAATFARYTVFLPIVSKP